MLINALRRADGEQYMQLTEWLGREKYDPQEKIQAVTALYDEIGIRPLAEAKINEYFEAALQSLEHVNLPAERKQPLRELALSLLQRKN